MSEHTSGPADGGYGGGGGGGGASGGGGGGSVARPQEVLLSGVKTNHQLIYDACQNIRRNIDLAQRWMDSRDLAPGLTEVGYDHVRVLTGVMETITSYADRLATQFHNSPTTPMTFTLLDASGAPTGESVTVEGVLEVGYLHTEEQNP